MVSSEQSIPVTFRSAVATDAAPLTDLSMRSKAYWPYSAEFIAKCRSDLTITPAFATSGLVVVAESAGKVVGYFGFEEEASPPELSHFFLEPEFIGRGMGTELWHEALAFAAQRGWPWFQICSDPYAAENFYEKKGCRRIGEYESRVVPGRMLPLLRYDLSAADLGRASRSQPKT